MSFAIDSNSSQAYAGEETTLGLQSQGPFIPLEINSYSDQGVDTKTVQRQTLNISRQQSKGTITETDVVAGFQSDFTQTNLARLMQGFYFADVIEKPKTVPTNGAALVTNAVNGGAGFAIGFQTSGPVAFQMNHLLFTTGFVNSANNGVFLCGGPIANGTVFPVGNLLVTEQNNANAKITAAGFQLSPQATMSGLSIIPTQLVDPGGVNFTTLSLSIGEWIYIGDIGNAAAAQNYNFVGATSGLILRGYARISGIAPTTLTFDFVTFAGNGDAAASTTAGVHIFFGNYLMNQNTLATIKRRSYTMPRYLGQGIGSASQLEVLLGCVPDKFTLNVAQASKLTADMTFVGIDALYQNAAMVTKTDGTPVSIYSPFNETAVNTSRDIYANLLTVNGTEAASLFAYATEAKYALDNGATIARALGTTTGFDVNVGDFKASWSGTTYFDDIAALQAVQNNADVGAVTIFASRSAGFVFDIPLLTLGGGKLKLEKDKKIMVDLTSEGCANAANYTSSYTRFSYLPASAMSKYAGL